jgi:predicted transcriptional regulator
MPKTAHRLLTLTTQIATAYVGANTIDAMTVPELIRVIWRSLIDLEPNNVIDPAKLRPSVPPAVEITKSIFANHLVCLEDGREATALKRHLRTAHGLTPEQYRAKWGLPASYPMVAPNYARLRSRLAKEFGLGHKGQRKKAPAS